MSQTLYRKYRSQTFAELVGQDAVVRVLRNAIVRQRLSHAYLFCGPRGTGKTSVARIFAKALNCLNPREGDACGVCEHCLAVAGGNAVDVIEIDAASNRSVEDVEDLRKRVGYAPLKFRYKVYIIDEVHMISTHGFNALLKTLEEPPAHVVFCLCTTEANKLPVTILSRCIRFDFTRIAPAKLSAHLQAITAQEGLSLDEDAALELAELAEGSARDAISLLDQLTVYCSGRISLKDIRELFQLGDPALMGRMLEDLASGEPQRLLGSWEELAQAGMDASRFLLDLADALKHKHLEQPGGRWRHALEQVWKGLNLLKYDNFPALLVELTLLEAQAALIAPAAAPQGSARAAQSPPPEAEPQRSPARMPERQPPSAAAGQGAGARPAMQIQRSPARDALDPPRESPQAATQERQPTAQPPQSVPESRPQSTPPAASAAPQSALAATGSDNQSSLELWERFLAALERVSLTTYALLWQGVSGRFAGRELQLGFPQSARQQYAWVQEARHVQAIVDTAAGLLGHAVGLRIAVLGEEATQLTLREAGAATEARARPAPLPPGDLPDEIVYDSAARDDEPEGPGAAGGPADPRQGGPAGLSEAERMNRQIDAALPADPQPEQPRLLSADEAASLFEGAEILEDEDAEY
ncbi:DNA polymerase III subunit gamma/tau [bacterium]|nr:DNA polymerase III subunit gamma/tau [bacterium]